MLEHEAIVQRDPKNAQAWFALGVKQQENEREQHAIDALREAVAQDPSCMPAYLALAVSFANEGDKVSAHRAIGSWLAGRGVVLRKVAGVGELGIVDGVATVEEIHQEYVSVLLNMARQASGGEIDADVQMALGVLLNTMEVGCIMKDLVNVGTNPITRITPKLKTASELRLLSDQM